MPALRDGGPVRRAVWQFVAFVDRHAVADIGEDPGGAQPPEAGSDDGRVFITPPHWVGQYSVRFPHTDQREGN